MASQDLASFMRYFDYSLYNFKKDYVVRIVDILCQNILFLSQNGIYFTDIKPENIVVV